MEENVLYIYILGAKSGQPQNRTPKSLGSLLLPKASSYVTSICYTSRHITPLLEKSLSLDSIDLYSVF